MQQLSALFIEPEPETNKPETVKSEEKAYEPDPDLVEEFEKAE